MILYNNEFEKKKDLGYAVIILKRKMSRFGLIKQLSRRTIIQGATIQQWDNVFTGNMASTLSELKLLSAELCSTRARSNKSVQTATKMYLHGVIALLESGDFLTSAEFGKSTNLELRIAAKRLRGWQHGKKVFAIQTNNQVYFPKYAFDLPNGCPLAVVEKILIIFDGKKDGFLTAVWFNADNSYLGGMRPAEMLAFDPDAVIESARWEVSDELHG